MAQEEHPDEKKWTWHGMEPDFKPLVNIASVVSVVPVMTAMTAMNRKTQLNDRIEIEENGNTTPAFTYRPVVDSNVSLDGSSANGTAPRTV